MGRNSTIAATLILGLLAGCARDAGPPPAAPPAASGLDRWRSLAAAAGEKLAPPGGQPTAYADLPADERFAVLATHLDDGVGSIVSNNLGDQAGWLAAALRTRVGTRAALAYASALDEVSPFLATPEDADPSDPFFRRGRAAEGRAACGRLDDAVRPLGRALEADVAASFSGAGRAAGSGS